MTFAHKPNGIHLTGSLYAHSLPEHAVEYWQRLDDHLIEVANLAAQFAGSFDSADWAWNAGLFHDFGKAAEEFQAYLRRENHLDDPEYDGVGKGRINHSSAGAALAEEFLSLKGRPLAYLIAGHHAGLPDYFPDEGGMGALQIRMKEGKENLQRIRFWVEEMQKNHIPLSNLPAFVKKENFHFWVRMLFSCLVDADFLNTESFMKPEQSAYRGTLILLEDMKSALDNHMKKLTAHCQETFVNAIRLEILKSCLKAAPHKPGLFSLTVPTGGGKTLSSLAFALEHALIHEKKRILYVIPYTSIIEQTAEILAGIFGRKNVVEHHSNLDPQQESLHTRLASENWEAPLIVTTNVQFFESLFSARSSRCRKLHNLIESVVILDEAQLVPPSLLTPCVAAINEMVSNYGVTLVLSTATQPALPGLLPSTEIIPSGLDLYKRLQRTTIQLPQVLEERLSWEGIAAELYEHDQVLCIVNSRRDCYDLFRLMPEGTLHLSALMCGEHRSKVIAEIKERLTARQTVRVISTQLVEAGVDIDFPVVYRALAGFDSIAQAAGRCNREGKLSSGMGRVVVFVPPKPAPRGLLHKGESTTKELISLPQCDVHSPEWFSRYFELFYRKLNNTGEEILKDLTPSSSQLLDVAFRRVGDQFQLIDNSMQRSVFVRYGESEKLLKELREVGPHRDLLRRLQRFTVNLPPSLVTRMYSDGLIEEIRQGYLAQCSLSLYDDQFGLDVFRETLPVEDLVL